MPPCPGFIPVRHQFNIPVYYSRAVGRGTFDGTAARKSMYSVRQRSVFAQRQINERTPVLVLHCRPLSFSVWHLSSLVHAVQLGAHLALIFLCEVFFPIFWLLITKYSLNFHTDIHHIGRKRRGFWIELWFLNQAKRSWILMSCYDFLNDHKMAWIAYSAVFTVDVLSGPRMRISLRISWNLCLHQVGTFVTGISIACWNMSLLCVCGKLIFCGHYVVANNITLCFRYWPISSFQLKTCVPRRIKGCALEDCRPWDLD